MTNLKKIFYCSLFSLLALLSYAQKKEQQNTGITSIAQLSKDSAAKLCVKDIVIKGNKKTKSYLILRETPFKKGDSLMISDFTKELQLARQQVYNTTLFVEVNVDLLVIDATDVVVTINVKERWSIDPVPQFQLVDRNFNEWIKTYKGSLDRVNYGVKFVHYNLTGKKDPLRIYLINGYTRNVSFSYTNPYSNHSLDEGFSVVAGYSQNREISYKTSYNNKILEYKKGQFVRNNAYGGVGFSLRKGLFKRHYFNVGYTHFTVDDSVVTANYNPHYFNSPGASKGVLDFVYRYQYTNVDNVAYPLRGTTAFLSISKRNIGFTGGLNMLSVEAGLNKYYSLGNKWYTGFQLNGKIKLPFEQAYLNQRGLGYGESYLRGLEYYVIDGVATALFRSTLKKKIFYFGVPFPFHSKTISKIPFTFYAKTYGDLGYSYNKKTYDSYLNNRLLYTGGFGLDILTLYDINLRLEYSFNQLHENGLFLHTQGGF